MILYITTGPAYLIITFLDGSVCSMLDQGDTEELRAIINRVS